MANENPRNRHKTKRVTIKAADVDVGIVPVVDWLNSFEGITTMYSCEGDGPPPVDASNAWRVNEGGYVQFTCSNLLLLRAIVTYLSHSFIRTIECCWHPHVELVFVIRFKSWSERNGLIDAIKNNRLPPELARVQD